MATQGDRMFQLIRLRSVMIAATLVAALGVFVSEAAWAQPGMTTCDPNVRTGNRACGPDAACRRLGNCGFLLNWLCVDDASTGKATHALSGTFPCNQCRGTVGVCETRGACNSDAGCAMGARGRCVLGTCTNVCQTNTECLAGEQCRDGLCQLPAPGQSTGTSTGTSSGSPSGTPSPPGRACTIEGSKAECAPGEICTNKHCRPIGPQCRSNDDCRSGEVCLQGQCRGI
jgi:hypothetical protein